MSQSGFNPSATESWKTLKNAAAKMSAFGIADAMTDERVSRYQAQCAGIYLDFSKNRIDDAALAGLFGLLNDSPFASLRAAMFDGEAINNTEQRAVLHTALRASNAELGARGLAAEAQQIAEQKQHIKTLSEKIRAGQWLGATGKPITDIVNMGIGGSDLGPKLASEALKEFAQPGLRCHFVANVDGELIRSTLTDLNPETTVVIVASKTFTTQETLLNANTAAAWFTERLGLAQPFSSPHFIGVTAAPDTAIELGFLPEQLLQFWDWVGGRYSMWSSIGLSIAISIGFERFEAMLDGAREMDQHFLTAPLEQNMPVILALLGIWYRNFLGAPSLAVIPYCERLEQFPFYLQQLDMESNGKGVNREGAKLDYQTGPVVWGLTGTNGQHSFFQLLHQGDHVVPVDFIGLIRDSLSLPEHHKVLQANMLAQSAALMSGKKASSAEPYRNYPGNRPSNTLLLDELTPKSFGALVALYEHKVFVQGAVWNINSFDQWGVELGKGIAKDLLSGDANLDASSRSLIGKMGW
ncbi:glucose-6-phosphate isomerase [Spongiibacter pelagi]|uniref:glucose-6-phosphate isomerase n=1 Tax=Spongiibacter pelagi TaxID=2760804 RepID=UPI00295BF67D|nr:glucose-6-phosphate isomerase [Spongiibacter pelagi]